MRRLLWMCLLVAMAAAELYDGGFEQFCLGEHLDSPLDDKDPKERYDSRLQTCTQTFTAVAGIAVADFCRARSPYLLSESKEENSKFKCTWKSVNCGRSWGTYISGKCYLLAQTCPTDYQMMTLKSKSVTRWLSLSFGSDALGEVNVAKDSFIEKAVYDHGRIYATTEKKSKTVLLLNRLPVWGYSAGQVVYLQNASSNLQKICEMKLTRTVSGSEQAKPDPGNGRTAADEQVGNSAWCSKRFRSSDGTFSVFSTCSTYQPRLKGADVDLHYFHEVCAAHCPGCYAATQKHVEKCPHVPKGAYYFPAASVAKSPSDSCSGNYDATVRMNKKTGFNVLYHPDHTSVLTEDKYWPTKRPDNRCADQGRRHVALVKGNLGVIFRDVPINDRLPILCVDGPKLPQAPDPDRCYVNSNPDGNGGCRCKSGFEDALDPKWNLQGYAASQGITQPGYVCVVQQCNNVMNSVNPPWKYLLLLVDGSGSIGEEPFAKMQSFAYGIGTWMSHKMGLYIAQYSDMDKDYTTGHAPPESTTEQYRAAAEAALGRYHYGLYEQAYKAMNQLTKAYIAITNGGAPALLILITDAGREGLDPSLEKPALAAARAAGMHIKVVPVNVAREAFANVVDDLDKDVIPMGSYDTLEKDLQSKLEKQTVCIPVTTDDFDNAARYA